jgi:hypothetical protein
VAVIKECRGTRVEDRGSSVEGGTVNQQAMN